MGLIQNKKTAMIGGGPGGLTLARLLQVNGYKVKVHERDIDQHVRPQGATLDLHQELGLKALTKAGLLYEFKKMYLPDADKTRVTVHNAVIHFDDHSNEEGEDQTLNFFGQRSTEVRCVIC